MKVLKLFISSVAFLLVCMPVQAQNSFFPTKAGTVLIYAQNDAKGKVGNYFRHTITAVEGSLNDMAISYSVELLDKNRKSKSEPIPMTVLIQDGAVLLDLKSMFAGLQTDAQFEVEISGTPMELPANLQPGQSLADAEVTITTDMVIMKMSTVIKMSEGKCLAIEDVTVAAGTFKCHKITQTVTSTVMKKTVVSRTVSWYAPGIGTVKNETYDSKDKLQNSMELVEITN